MGTKRSFFLHVGLTAGSYDVNIVKLVYEISVIFSYASCEGVVWAGV